MQDIVGNNIKKITYDKKYDRVPFICMIGTGLVTAVTSISSIRLNLSDNLIFLPLFLGLSAFLVSLFLLSNHYNHSDLPRHELAANFVTSTIGTVAWVSVGRQTTIIKGEFFIQSNKIVYEDRFKSYDGMNDLKEGDKILVKYNPDNLKEFVLCKLANNPRV